MSKKDTRPYGEDLALDAERFTSMAQTALDDLAQTHTLRRLIEAAFSSLNRDIQKSLDQHAKKIDDKLYKLKTQILDEIEKISASKTEVKKKGKK